MRAVLDQIERWRQRRLRILEFANQLCSLKEPPLRPLLRYPLIDSGHLRDEHSDENEQDEVEEPNERDGALMVVAAKEVGLDSLKLAHAFSRALWAEERFPFVRDELIAIATTEGFDGEELWEQSRSDTIAESYANNTRQSIDRDVFGMPFYIVSGQPYCGQDRLELIEHQLSHT